MEGIGRFRAHAVLLHPGTDLQVLYRKLIPLRRHVLVLAIRWRGRRAAVAATAKRTGHIGACCAAYSQGAE